MDTGPRRRTASRPPARRQRVVAIRAIRAITDTTPRPSSSGRFPRTRRPPPPPPPPPPPRTVAGHGPRTCKASLPRRLTRTTSRGALARDRALGRSWAGAGPERGRWQSRPLLSCSLSCSPRGPLEHAAGSTHYRTWKKRVRPACRARGGMRGVRVVPSRGTPGRGWLGGERGVMWGASRRCGGAACEMISPGAYAGDAGNVPPSHDVNMCWGGGGGYMRSDQRCVYTRS